MQPSTFYYIYNCANGSENLYRSEENYHFFLRRWSKYIEPVADTYCYCLMPNHFHFLIKTKSQEEVEQTFGKFETFQKLSYRYSKQFANLFSSYTQSYNKMYNRRGSLFNPNFKAKEINSNAYFTNITHYIHHNPKHHGFANKIEEWPYSSYNSLRSQKTTKLQRDETLSWFGSKNEFEALQTTEFSSLQQFEEKYTTT